MPHRQGRYILKLPKLRWFEWPIYVVYIPAIVLLLAMFPVAVLHSLLGREGEERRWA